MRTVIKYKKEVLKQVSLNIYNHLIEVLVLDGGDYYDIHIIDEDYYDIHIIDEDYVDDELNTLFLQEPKTYEIPNNEELYSYLWQHVIWSNMYGTNGKLWEATVVLSQEDLV